jgi:hypothetical protein
LVCHRGEGPQLLQSIETCIRWQYWCKGEVQKCQTWFQTKNVYQNQCFLIWDTDKHIHLYITSEKGLTRQCLELDWSDHSCGEMGEGCIRFGLWRCRIPQLGQQKRTFQRHLDNESMPIIKRKRHLSLFFLHFCPHTSTPSRRSLFYTKSLASCSPFLCPNCLTRNF